MTRFTSMKATFLVSALLLSAVVVTQADASWYHDPTGGHRAIGSAANPTPRDLVAIRLGPDYPVQSRMFNEQGKVALKIWLTEQGTMTDAVVEHSSGYARLDEAAVRYIKDHWQYRPTKSEAMPKTVLAEVIFRLE